MEYPNYVQSTSAIRPSIPSHGTPKSLLPFSITKVRFNMCFPFKIEPCCRWGTHRRRDDKGEDRGRLIFISCCCDKIPWKSNLGEKGSIQLTVLGCSQPPWRTWRHITHTQSRAETLELSLLSLLLHNPGCSAQRLVSPTVGGPAH